MKSSSNSQNILLVTAFFLIAAVVFVAAYLFNLSSRSNVPLTASSEVLRDALSPGEISAILAQEKNSCVVDRIKYHLALDIIVTRTAFIEFRVKCKEEASYRSILTAQKDAFRSQD